VHNCVAPFTSQGKLHEFGAKKPISWAKPAHFNFLTTSFTVWSHILSTSGDASIAQFLTLHIYFSHPSLVVFILLHLATPRLKLKLGQHNGGGPLIANHLDQSWWWANQKHWPPVRSHLLHSLLQVHTVTVELYWARPAYVDIFSSKFSVQENTEHPSRCSNTPTTGNFLLLDLHW